MSVGRGVFWKKSAVERTVRQGIKKIAQSESLLPGILEGLDHKDKRNRQRKIH